ncbi:MULTISPECIES: glycosyltransferase family 2 protein [unclassified Exiguobacterium]|uniref:glycosyltransferase family 2 protein n=1 Tax=unclassified Exiguobacterium TaxID=2644629 RepID=UPI001BEC3579|nr:MULTISPECIES: glycosyltransferase family 2 protein [unclassified Exiguobacterium]
MPSLTPLVSLVVPVYNASAYVRQCLDSLTQQTYPHVEIICINDGSTDDSHDILMEYIHDPRVQVLDQTNRGCAFSRTRGLGMATGEYIMFIDSDDWLDLDAVRVLVEHAERERADAVMGTYVREYKGRSLPKKIFDADFLSFDADETKRHVHRRLFGLVGEELAHPENVDALNSNCFTLYHRDLVKHLTFGSGPYGTFNDLYFQIEALENCQRFVYVDYPVYHYRKTDAGSMSSAYKRDLVTSRLQFFHILMRYIETHHLGEEYMQALYNRIALSMIGIGLNELAAPKSLFAQAESLKQVLRQDEYKQAYSQMELEHFDVKWRTFFQLCKHERTVPLVLMLHGVDYLRKRV